VPDVLRLPSGLRVRVRAGKPVSRPLPHDDAVDGVRLFAGGALRALREGRLRVERADGARGPLGPAAIDALDLRDFHVLRDCAIRLGVVDPGIDDADAQAPRCRNCDGPLPFAPRGLPLDGLLGRFDDEPPRREARVLLGPGVRVERSPARAARLRTPTVAEARPLWAALARDAPLTLGPALVRAMGIAALELGGGARVRARGTAERRAERRVDRHAERHPARIARALDGAPDAAWERVCQGFLLVAYPEAAFVPVRCPRCEAIHDFDAPEAREFWPEPAVMEAALGGETAGARRRAAREAPPFPDEAAFEALVARVGAEVYAARGVRNVALRVETGVPAVDEGGEPLLGSYEPLAGEDLLGQPTSEFLITLYYRTFRAMYEDDGPYDVAAEVRDTIDHEVEHHLYYLAGHDPMDAAERAEARRELARAVGPVALRRAEREVLVRRLRGPLGVALLALLAIAGISAWLASRAAD
jgi:hypothetical protein